MININIAKEYSNTPGSRYRFEGKFSGEDFRETLLLPRLLEAEKNDDLLEINLDGGYGYATSFLEEAFGGLVRRLKRKDFTYRISFISQDEPSLIDEIWKYIDAVEVGCDEEK